MKKRNEIIKVLKSWYYASFNKSLPKALKTTGFRDGKQSSFLCGECGFPVNTKGMNPLVMEYYEKDYSEHLPEIHTKILCGPSWYKGFALRPQIQYFKSIKREGSLLSCSHCRASGYQNIIVQKIKDWNLCILI